jgi:hypothetical protein
MSLAPDTTSDPRYPIGRFDRSAPITPESLATAIDTIAAMPANLRNALAGLSEAQLDTPYREGGWTVRQLVHHLADSHSMALIRNKLALTEDAPVVNAYSEKAWAELEDCSAPVECSQMILEGIHARWVLLLRSMSPEQFARVFLHPERGPMALGQVTSLYAWHSLHHVAHIASLRARNAW